MSLNNTLNTNEVKNSAGTEIEFQRLSSSDRKTVFAKIGETPSAPFRLTINHEEIGSGFKTRRRSLLRFDLTSISGVDSITPITDSAYVVLDTQVGASSTSAQAANVLAALMSFLATTGSGTTVLLDGTGNGATALLNGSL